LYALNTAVTNVVKEGSLASGAQVDFFVTDKSEHIIYKSTTSAEGKFTFSPKGSEVMYYTAKVTPSEGITCQDSCFVEITLNLGKIPEYTVILLPHTSTSVINVVQGGDSVPGV
jgi:hypothetical protein